MKDEPVCYVILLVLFMEETVLFVFIWVPLPSVKRWKL